MESLAKMWGCLFSKADFFLLLPDKLNMPPRRFPSMSCSEREARPQEGLPPKEGPWPARQEERALPSQMGSQKIRQSIFKIIIQFHKSVITSEKQSHLETCRFMIRDWLTQLWSLAHPNTSSGNGQEGQWYGSSPKAGGLETQEEPLFQ